MKENLKNCLMAAEQTQGKAQRRLFPRKRAGQTLTREQVRAIKKGRRLLKSDLKRQGLKTKEDFELMAASFGLYFDPPKATAWLRWLFFGRGLVALLMSLGLLLLALFALAIVSEIQGHFTINMSTDLFREGFILSETADFENPTTHLFCTPAEKVPCISFTNIPEDVDGTDGQHNADYFAYTFYIRNEGDSTVGYEWMVSLNSESKNLSAAMWAMIFEDGKMRFYAKSNADGGVELLPAGDAANRVGYIGVEDMMHQCADPDTQFEPIHTSSAWTYYRLHPFAFESDTVVASGVRLHVAPGEQHKYTVVLWLEGDDPDCTDELIGGHAGLNMDFALLSETHGAGDEQTPAPASFWEKLWSYLRFWD